MADSKDATIKLFGHTIPFPETSPEAADSGCGDQEEEPPCSSINTSSEEGEIDEDQMEGDRTEMIQETGTTSHGLDKSQNPDPKVGINENQKASLSATEERSTTELSKTDEQKSETNASQEKTPKKPDKILPCPRCNSMETKFCYYNNYNVSQPRHFCKNCQRYWTAGGTMRNVHVGAGRRKNKNSVAHYRQITVPEVLQGAQTETPNGIQPAIKTNGTILAFGTDAPLCESMACVLNIAEKTVMNCTQNGFHKPEDLKITAPLVVSESANEQSGHSNSKDDESNAGLNEPIAQNFPSFPSQIPCFPSASWPYPWNPSQWSSMPPPAFCPNGFAIPFYPAPPAYWGCTIPGTWNFPWVPHQSLSLETNSNSGPNSPTLGKHCRDENLLKTGNSEDKDLGKDSNSERCLWVPKTLRIDDPEEAAKSSIWTTLGIKNDCKVGSIHGGGLFKAFQPKGVEKNHTMETTSVLQANPAALSRSQTFHESS